MLSSLSSSFLRSFLQINRCISEGYNQEDIVIDVVLCQVNAAARMCTHVTFATQPSRRTATIPTIAYLFFPFSFVFFWMLKFSRPSLSGFDDSFFWMCV